VRTLTCQWLDIPTCPERHDQHRPLGPPGIRPALTREVHLAALSISIHPMTDDSRGWPSASIPNGGNTAKRQACWRLSASEGTREARVLT
jgi:hypothetical protein